MTRVCNARKSQPTKWTIMLLLCSILILTIKKRWLAMCNRNLHDCIHVSIPHSLRFGHLSKWKTRQPWRWIATGNPCEFLFYGPEKAFKLTKNKITKIKENWNETVKHCLIWPLLLGVSAIERSVLEVNVKLDLKIMSTIDRSLL